jgi:MFS family permease
MHNNKKDLIIAWLSGLIQYYDYHLFGFLAAKIAQNFLPPQNSSVMLLSTYFIMFIGVTAKPIAAWFLGKIGDLYDRQKAINTAIILTAIASLVIGLAPTYESIGISAAFILSLMRMSVAGFTSSGSDGVRLYIYEKIGKKSKNFGTALGSISTIGGSFLASISALFFTLESLPAYSWRLAFIVGAFGGLMIVSMRILLGGSDLAIKQEAQYQQYKDMALIGIIKEHAQLFVFCVCLAGCIGASYSYHFVFLPSYNFELIKIVEQSQMGWWRSLGIASYMACALIGGVLADVTSSRTICRLAICMVILLAFVNCLLARLNIFSGAIYLAISSLLPISIIPALTILKSAMPKVIRYRLFSMAHSMGSIFISAPCAFIATMIYHQTKNSALVHLYFALVMIVMFCAVHIISKLTKNNAD